MILPKILRIIMSVVTILLLTGALRYFLVKAIRYFSVKRK